MLRNKYLPIGSVVLVKNAKKKLMITGILQKMSDNNELYDYSACIYPIGIYSSDKLFMFNNEDIDIVYAYGFQDEEYFSFIEKIQDIQNNE